jgi:hypothetical protein
MNKILAFVDLLGFTKMIEKDHVKSKELLHDFYTIVFNSLENNEAIKGNISSDCVMIYSDHYSELINCVTNIYRLCFKFNKNSQDPDFYLLPRGAVSVGYMDIGDRDTSLHLTKDFMIGPALVHSSKLEQQIKGSRLLVAINSDDENQVKDLKLNPNLTSPLYENCTFKFWDNYSYFDALWFLDLSKNETDQKTEVTELLNIAIQLLKINSNKTKIVEHYINTLRLGLLSYNKFIQPKNDPVIQQILKEFPHETYWLLWLTIIEITMKSESPIHLDENICKFYKNAILSNGWIHVIEEINKTGKQYLKNNCNDFLELIYK